MSFMNWLKDLLSPQPPAQAPMSVPGGVMADAPVKPAGTASSVVPVNVFVVPPGATRGIRNHNPGNVLRSADKWQGMAPVQTDVEMVQFVSPEYGLRAIIVIARNYQKRGKVTVRQFVETWCPPKHTLPSGKVVDNHTPQYVAFVSAALGSRPDDRLDLTNRAVVEQLLRAVVRQENGSQPYDSVIFHRAMDLAGVPI